MQRSKFTRIASLFGLSMLALCLGACSKTPRLKLPKTYPVVGSVTCDGQPVAGASVMFNSIENGGYGSVAVTDTNGRYKLMTFSPGDGVVPGDYKVAITKLVLEGSGGDSPMASSGDPKNLLPTKYADDSASGLKATVEAKPDNVFDFALTK